MAFGVKVKNIKTKQKYSLEGFFEAIKDKPFTAGQPAYVKHGFAYVIVFPALDSNNQVWITSASLGAQSQKFSVQKSSQEAGVGNMAANMAMDGLTGGLFGMKGVVGKNAKLCEQLVDTTVQELETLGL